MITIIVFFFLILPKISTAGDQYICDTSVGFGRTFDGIGAISGGGATSKLLINYPERQKSEILDFLFKPNYGAALQILKVEIGGDAQSTGGSESSHMHEEWDENFHRGYEWYLMKEAKKRNPKIQLCGLPWGFPGWLGQGRWTPYANVTKTAYYILRWIWGAKYVHGLNIDCIGIWNEKPYNIEYIKILRKMLNENGFNKTKIVAADNLPGNAWSIVNDIKHDNTLNESIDIIGAHYTGSYSSLEAQKLSQPLWSTEDVSDGVDEEAAGCLARVLNQNYVFGKFTSTITWDLISSFYDNIMSADNGFMLANQPWSGFYIISSPIWAAAHTTQFTDIGWKYLADDAGVGRLKDGGTLVSLVSPDLKQFTIVIETMDTSNGSFCVRAPSVPTPVKVQDIYIVLKGALVNITQLNLWHSQISTNGVSQWFKYIGKQKITENKISLTVLPNSIYTLTTIEDGRKGNVNYIPIPKQFPLPYKDNFNEYNISSEPFNFSPQVGSFEVTSSPYSDNKFMRQVVLTAPIHWCPFLQSSPMGVIGSDNWSDIKASVDVLFPPINSSSSIFLGVNTDRGGCTAFLAKGLFFYVSIEKQMAFISRDIEMTDIIAKKMQSIEFDYWYNLKLVVRGNQYYSYFNGNLIFYGKILPSLGYVSLGCGNFGLADFDNLYIS